MKVLKWIGILLASIAALVLVLAFAARFHDGPIGPFPGGPMDGEVVTDKDVDWSFAATAATTQLQTSDPPRSRNVWVIVRDGELYVPSLFVGAKTWPHKVAEDPVVMLRFGDLLFVRTAVRVEDPALLEALWADMASKYATTAPDDYEGHWIFRMDPFDPDV